MGFEPVRLWILARSDSRVENTDANRGQKRLAHLASIGNQSFNLLLCHGDSQCNHLRRFGSSFPPFYSLRFSSLVVYVPRRISIMIPSQYRHNREKNWLENLRSLGNHKPPWGLLIPTRVKRSGSGEDWRAPKIG